MITIIMIIILSWISFQNNSQQWKSKYVVLVNHILFSQLLATDFKWILILSIEWEERERIMRRERDREKERERKKMRKERDGRWKSGRETREGQQIGKGLLVLLWFSLSHLSLIPFLHFFISLSLSSFLLAQQYFPLDEDYCIWKLVQDEWVRERGNVLVGKEGKEPVASRTLSSGETEKEDRKKLREAEEEGQRRKMKESTRWCVSWEMKMSLVQRFLVHERFKCNKCEGMKVRKRRKKNDGITLK